MNRIFLFDTNKGQFPTNEEEAYMIAEKAGYTKEDIKEYFETNLELRIKWKGWDFKFVV